MEGASFRATRKRAFTNFSDSPKYFEVRDEELMEKNVDFDSVATARANMVLPVPGGPKSSIPLVGSRRPLNKSGRRNG